VSVGSDQARLIVLRGNSGSGKTIVARALCDAYGRGVAWVSQDLIRRIILREKDRPGGANIGLIEQVARYSLDPGRDATPPGTRRGRLSGADLVWRLRWWWGSGSCSRRWSSWSSS
jgi:hypothetical protein